jgi:putative membrane protein
MAHETNRTEARDSHEHRFEVRASAESHFSWIRTRLSVERTLMSWVRTATALIGFGFTIVQFFERMQSMDSVAPALRPQMPRYLGLALIAAGIAGLIVSLWQYRSLLDYLHDEFEPIAGIRRIHHQTPLMAVTIALLLIGIVAFVAVLIRAV